MIKEFEVAFEENGSEYIGLLKVICEKIERIGDKVFKADGVVIKINEKILSIEELIKLKNKRSD